MSSDECLPKRWCGSLQGIPSYVLDVCDGISDGNRNADMSGFFESIKAYSVHDKCQVFDMVLQALTKSQHSLPLALKQLLCWTKALRTPAEDNRDAFDCNGYMARKILGGQIDDLSAFHDDIRNISSYGYQFDELMVNRLMNHCIKNFDPAFFKFTIPIVNQASAVYDLNGEILRKYTGRRLQHHRQGIIKLPRGLGISRKMSHIKP